MRRPGLRAGRAACGCLECCASAPCNDRAGRVPAPLASGPCPAWALAHPHEALPPPFRPRSELLRRGISNIPWVDCIPQQGLNVYSILQVCAAAPAAHAVVTRQSVPPVGRARKSGSAVLCAHPALCPAPSPPPLPPAARLPAAHAPGGRPAGGAPAAAHQAVQPHALRAERQTYGPLCAAGSSGADGPSGPTVLTSDEQEAVMLPNRLAA